MTREIKYRQAMYNKDGSFREWHYWGFVEQYGQLTYVGPETSGSTIEGALRNSHPYTQIKDNKGIRIYGDALIEVYLVLPCIRVICQVIFIDECGWILQDAKLKYGLSLRDLADECEVIGSMQEDSGLWEEETNGY